MPTAKKAADIPKSSEATTAKPAKKAAAKQQAKTIKYEDKSPGQPELLPIFDSLKMLLKPYVKGSLKAQEGTAGTYSVGVAEPVEILGKKRDLYFAGIMVQKGYVGFYFFPIYTDPVIAKDLQPELLKCLKGKSCFHIKKNDPKLLQQVEQALEVGYNLYHEKGYV